MWSSLMLAAWLTVAAEMPPQLELINTPLGMAAVARPAQLDRKSLTETWRSNEYGSRYVTVSGGTVCVQWYANVAAVWTISSARYEQGPWGCRMQVTLRTPGGMPDVDFVTRDYKSLSELLVDNPELGGVLASALSAWPQLQVRTYQTVDYQVWPERWKPRAGLDAAVLHALEQAGHAHWKHREQASDELEALGDDGVMYIRRYLKLQDYSVQQRMILMQFLNTRPWLSDAQVKECREDCGLTQPHQPRKSFPVTVPGLTTRAEDVFEDEES